MTTPIFFLFLWYAFVLAKRPMKKIDTLHNNFSLKRSALKREIQRFFRKHFYSKKIFGADSNEIAVTYCIG
jgi:hypothetical protein